MSFPTIRRTLPFLRAFKCAANFDVRILLSLMHLTLLTAVLFLAFRF